MYGHKEYSNGGIVIQVDGFPRWRFFYYTMKSAEKEYRERFDLKYKRITWY